MYEGIPFSPQTFLANNVGAGDTVIAVDDISFFPDAPNFATISWNGDAETVRYSAKTATELSGCTRGVEGIPRSWPVGAFVARNFTAEDYEAMRENIAAIPLAVEKDFVPLAQDKNNVRVLRGVTGKYLDVNGTGILKISLPTTWTGGNMAIKAAGYEYHASKHGAWELLLGGYANAIAGNWERPSAVLTGRAKLFDRARFGHDGQKCCILLGDQNTAWAYPHIVIDRVSLNTPETPHEGWDVSIIPDESGITNIAETPVRWVATDDGVWYDMTLLNGATAGTASAHTLQYRKIGNVVYLSGLVNPNTMANIHIATLPAGYRPARFFKSTTVADATDRSWDRIISANPDGTIVIAGGVHPVQFYIDCSFIAA